MLGFLQVFECLRQTNNQDELAPRSTISAELDAQISDAVTEQRTIAATLSGVILGDSTLESGPRSYEELQETLLSQSQENQAALDEIDQIEESGLLDEPNIDSLLNLSDHISKIFQQVDQLEKVVDFMEKKALALDQKMASLDKEQQEWIGRHNTTK
ncbi:hypothetical protein DSO57_1010318 [Entomophthora muscae]|uniref:Uncharacterized protein n=1 Tax=Entomophthora muscae TaxID=34485 RepID=A0ACC2SVN0_9FUNG|nr:hypothetical protein DSO57_1010318 [Entomophthora muscae]